MNVYSELLDLLLRQPESAPGGIFGSLTGYDPVAVTVRGTAITEGLFAPKGTRFREEDLGAQLALLPCEEGFLILFQAQEVSS